MPGFLYPGDPHERIAELEQALAKAEARADAWREVGCAVDECGNVDDDVFWDALELAKSLDKEMG